MLVAEFPRTPAPEDTATSVALSSLLSPRGWEEGERFSSLLLELDAGYFSPHSCRKTLSLLKHMHRLYYLLTCMFSAFYQLPRESHFIRALELGLKIFPSKLNTPLVNFAVTVDDSVDTQPHVSLSSKNFIPFLLPTFRGCTKDFITQE